MSGVRRVKVICVCRECGEEYLAQKTETRDGRCERCDQRERARAAARRKAQTELGLDGLKGSGTCVVCGQTFTYQARRYVGEAAPTMCQAHRKQESWRNYEAGLSVEQRAERAARRAAYVYVWGKCGRCGERFKYLEERRMPEECPACRRKRPKPEVKRREKGRVIGAEVEARPKEAAKVEKIPMGLYGVLWNPLNVWDCRVMDYREWVKRVEADEEPIGLELMSRRWVGMRVEVDGLKRMGNEETQRRMEAWSDDDQTGEDGAEDETDEAVGVRGRACDGAGGAECQRAQPIAFVPASD